MRNEINDFNENGYVLVKNFFSSERISKVLNWLDRQDLETKATMWTDQEPGVPLAVWPWIDKQNTPLADLGKDDKILDFSSKLLGSDVYIWASKLNFKAAWCGTVEYYHQDLIYWKDRGYQKNDMLSCMTFLDKHELSNAALHIFPGSHKIGLLEHMTFANINGLAKNMIIPEKLDTLNQKYPVKHIEADPGDVLFFHSLLVHGSAHNISPRPRRITLSQINSIKNIPTGVDKKAKEAVIKRAEYEVNETKRKYDWFKEKLESQTRSDKILFTAPIPKKEKSNRNK
tara:strand:- start:1192 stop:2049 length:858 start_codon:yes stop_codon:yes gene_type:complete